MGFPKTYKLKFLTIGYIEWRKGQDLLAEAIEQLPSDILEKVEFVLVGQKTSSMAESLSKKIEAFPNVFMPGTVSREEVHRLLDGSDVLICPSREDPMPTVCAEAMMYKVPCLVSSATGTAAYIRDEYDGLVFETEDVSELKEKIIWCVSNSDKLKGMGEKAYEIYENIFSAEAFERNLLTYVEKMIGKA